MMTLVCINPFGRFMPGDEVLVPDGAIFDTAYFAAKPAESDEKGDEESADTEEKE